MMRALSPQIKSRLALLLMASCVASHADVIVSDPLGGQAGSSIHERITPTGGLTWYRQWPWSSSAATVFASDGTGITRGETGNSSAASLWLPSDETIQVLTVQANILVGSRSGENTSTWGAIGFSSNKKTGDGFPYGPVGNPDTSILRVLLTNSGNWILSSANTTLASGSGIATGSPVTLSLTIDPANALASLRIGGAPAASGIAIPGSLPAVAAAGFQLFDGDAGSGIVKNFSVSKKSPDCEWLMLETHLVMPGIHIGTDASLEDTTSGNGLANNGHDITTTEGFSLGQNIGSIGNALIVSGGTFNSTVTDTNSSSMTGNMVTVGRWGNNNTLIIADDAAFNVTDTHLRIGFDSDYNLVSVSSSELTISGVVDGTATASLCLGGISGVGNRIVISNMSRVKTERLFIGGMLAQGDASHLNSIVVEGGCELIISDPDNPSLNIGYIEDGVAPNVVDNHLTIHANATVYVENASATALRVNAPENQIRLVRIGLQAGHLYWSGYHTSDFSRMISAGVFLVSVDGGNTWMSDTDETNYKITHPAGPRSAYTLLQYNKQ